MARGRMLNVSISLSIKFNRLTDDTCRLLATWCIPHLDHRGVFYADPEIVKGQVMPMQTSLTLERIEHYLLDMQRVGLIVLFTHDERRWMFWPGFTHNQTIRAGKERSRFPMPPADGQQDDSASKDNSPPTGGPQADNRQPTGSLRAKTSLVNEMKGNEKKDIAAEPASAPFESHNTSVAGETELSFETPPTVTHIPQTDRRGTGDALSNIMERALKVKANPGLATVGRWNLPPHLTGICEDYVSITGAVVKPSDKGLFLAGAKDIHDLFTASTKAYSRPWMEQAIKTANWSHAHPRALDKSFRELFKKGWTPAGTPDGEGLVTAGFRFNDDGSVTQLVRAVAHV